MSSQPQQVAGDPVQLRQDGADILGSRRSLHVEQFFHRLAIAEPVGNRSHIVHAVHVRGKLDVGPVFGNLFHAAMQITDDAFGPQHLFAVQLQDGPENSVGGGVLRAHVDDDLVGVQESGWRLGAHSVSLAGEGKSKLREVFTARSRSADFPAPISRPAGECCNLSARDVLPTPPAAVSV